MRAIRPAWLNKTLAALWLVSFCLNPSVALADWPMDFVRITCIPEARFFKVEYTPVNGGDAYAGTRDRKEELKRKRAWEKAGFYTPSNLKYECKIPDATYQVTANQPPARERGHCGGDPDVTISISVNGTPVIEKVLFGSSCDEIESLSSLTVLTTEVGWGGGFSMLCVYPTGGMPGSYSASLSTPEQCGFFDDSKVLNQQGLKVFLKEKSRK